MFRNRLAHHDSLLAVDVPFRFGQMRQVLEWVDPRAEQWLLASERISAVLAERPSAPKDTVIVAAKEAWPLYLDVGAYVCQAGRSFQSVTSMGFYADREIKPEVAGVRHRLDNVEWSEAEAARRRMSRDEADQQLADVILRSRELGWTDGRYQVFVLTRPGDTGHLTLPGPVPHRATGRGSAFAKGQRYTWRDALSRAESTSDLS